MGSKCLIDIEFVFGVIEKFGKWTMVMVTTLHVLHATELYI